jgi:hypothetical protein
MRIESGSICRIVDSKCLSRMDRHYINRECEVVGPVDESVRNIMRHEAVFAVRILGVADAPLLCATCLKPIQTERFVDLATTIRATNWRPKVPM